jgi:hypothetical protein
MSIVVTVVSKRAVVQVSDIRLSSLKGAEPLPQLQRKSIFVTSKHAVFVLGWAGLAFTDDGFNTGDWLFQALNHMRAFNLPVSDIAANLAGQATYEFNRLSVPQKKKCCRFILAGWQRVSGNVELFTAVIFNDLIYNSQAQHGESVWTESPTANSQFMYSIGSFCPVEFPYSVQAIGSANPKKIKAQLKVLKKVMEKHGGTTAITRACVQIAREAARHTRTISEDLIAVDISNNGRRRCWFFSEDGAEEMLVPDTISPRGSTTQGTIRAIFSGDEVSLKFRAKVLKKTQE